MAKEIEQPDIESERLLEGMIDNSVDYVSAEGHKHRYAIRWLKGFTRHKMTEVILGEDNDDKCSCMMAALIILNDFWKIKLFYPIYWRWLYYVRQFGEEELVPILLMGKKKVPQMQYLLVTTLAIGMKDTIMTMTKKETERFLREHLLEQQAQSRRGTSV